MRRGTHENRVRAASLTTLRPSPAAVACRCDLMKDFKMEAFVVFTREETTDPEEFVTQIHVNLTAPWLLTQACLPILRLAEDADSPCDGTT